MKRVTHSGRVTRSTTVRPLRAARPSGPALGDLQQAAGQAVAQARQRTTMGRLQQLITVDPRVAQSLMQLGQHIIDVPDQDDDGECRHRTGSLAFDGTPKVWLCSQCEWLYQLVDPGDGSDPIMVGVE